MKASAGVNPRVPENLPQLVMTVNRPGQLGVARPLVVQGGHNFSVHKINVDSHSAILRQWSEEYQEQSIMNNKPCSSNLHSQLYDRGQKTEPDYRYWEPPCTSAAGHES